MWKVDFAYNDGANRKVYDVYLHGEKLDIETVYMAAPGKYGSVQVWSQKLYKKIDKRGVVELINKATGTVVTE